VGDYCANQITFARLANLSGSIICPKPIGDEWHKQDCLMGDCSSCVFNTLKVCPTKELFFVLRMVQSQRYAKVVIGHKNNGDYQKVT
jgi:hypothetical protein